MVGGSLLEENCYRWLDEQVLGLWGDSLHPSSRENTTDCFEKHGLHSMPQGLRISCKTCNLYFEALVIELF